MKRYPHYLTPAAGGRWPSFVVAVRCMSESCAAEGISGAWSEEFASWHCIGYRRSQVEYREVHSACGQSRRAFWDSLYELTAKIGNVWVMSFDASRDWGLLGLWEEMENGNMLLFRPGSSTTMQRKDTLFSVQQIADRALSPVSAGAMSRMHDNSTGYLITSGTISTARLFVMGSRRAITWTDLRNYGITDMGPVNWGVEPARIVGDAYLRLYKALIECNLGSLRTTAGSQAMHGWRHSRDDTPVFCHCDRDAVLLEEKSYYGGRCEAYRIGKVDGPLWHLDVRSMYPWLCANLLVPTMLERIGTGPFPRFTLPAEGDHGVIAEVTVKTGEPCYPFRRDGEVIWPVGRFRTTLAGPELMDAAKHKRIIATHAWAQYLLTDALKAYATKVYAFRELCDAVGDKLMTQVAKRLLVALPGKLGQKQQIWIDALKADLIDLYGEWYGTNSDGELCRFRCIGGTVQQEVKMGYVPDAVPAISSWITSAGRMMLLGFIRDAGWDNVLYVDTDALIVTENGLGRLVGCGHVAACQWGKLRIEKKISRLEICGIKHYTADGKRICAGLPKGAMIDSDGKAYLERYLSPNEQIIAKQRPQVIRLRVPWTKQSEYLHGNVRPDGSVLPWRIGG